MSFDVVVVVGFGCGVNVVCVHCQHHKTWNLIPLAVARSVGRSLNIRPANTKYTKNMCVCENKTRNDLVVRFFFVVVVCFNIVHTCTGHNNSTYQCFSLHSYCSSLYISYFILFFFVMVMLSNVTNNPKHGAQVIFWSTFTSSETYETFCAPKTQVTANGAL